MYTSDGPEKLEAKCQLNLFNYGPDKGIRVKPTFVPHDLSDLKADYAPQSIWISGHSHMNVQVIFYGKPFGGNLEPGATMSGGGNVEFELSLDESIKLR